MVGRAPRARRKMEMVGRARRARRIQSPRLITVRLEAANYDLHSGEHGGIAPNPAQGMAELIASLHNPDGSIAVRGFCDHVVPPTDEERAAAESAAVSPEEYEKITGVPPVGGEQGLTLTERNSFRPTIEVNGIHTGYGGPGSKTVIPAGALAKISMRLVPNQNPDEVMAALERHLKQHTPRGMKLFIEDLTGGAAGFRLPLASPVFRLAASVPVGRRVDSGRLHAQGVFGRGAAARWVRPAGRPHALAK